MSSREHRVTVKTYKCALAPRNLLLARRTLFEDEIALAKGSELTLLV